MADKNNNKYNITERSLIDYYEYLSGTRKHIPYIVITFPFLNRADLTLREIAVYSVIYNISMSKNVAFKNKNNKNKNKNKKASMVDDNEDVNVDMLNNSIEGIEVTFNEIKQSLDINKSSLSRTIQDLEDKKLIKTVTFKKGGAFNKKVKVVQDMAQYDKDFIKEVEAECRKMVLDGVTFIELGSKVVPMDEVCAKVCGESFEKIRSSKGKDSKNKDNKDDKNKDSKNNKGKDNETISTAKKEEEKEDFYEDLDEFMDF